MPTSRPRTIIAITFLIFSIALVAFFTKTAGGNPIPFSEKGIQNVGLTFAPLVALAAFIERAVEVVISTTRGPLTLQLKHALAAKAGEDNRKEREALQHARLETQAFAFTISLGLSLFAALVGVRAVSSLVEVGAAVMSPRQHAWFHVFDVGLTALLLSGGSDGIHQVVTTITGFLPSTKEMKDEKK